MKKLFSFLFIFSLTICFSACYTTNTTTVANSADVSRYNYATITNVMDYGGSAVLMDLEIKIYDALLITRLQVIGDKEIDSLNDIQKQKLLLVRFAASQSNEESVVSINFVDYLTGRPVASCRGAYGFGWGMEHDMRVAINNALEQMKKLF
jgi:hypothetical protein